MTTKQAVIDPCTYCEESTAFGSGNFVNRIPADNGWACANCAGYECDHCEEQIYLDTDHSVDGEGHYHYECLPITEEIY